MLDSSLKPVLDSPQHAPITEAIGKGSPFQPVFFGGPRVADELYALKFCVDGGEKTR
jgi:hypothetical protein